MQLQPTWATWGFHQGIFDLTGNKQETLGPGPQRAESFLRKCLVYQNGCVQRASGTAERFIAFRRAERWGRWEKVDGQMECRCI
jgi:hypothetical protein